MIAFWLFSPPQKSVVFNIWLSICFVIKCETEKKRLLQNKYDSKRLSNYVKHQQSGYDDILFMEKHALKHCFSFRKKHP